MPPYAVWLGSSQRERRDTGHGNASLHRPCNVRRRLALSQGSTHMDSKNYKLHKSVTLSEIPTGRQPLAPLGASIRAGVLHHGWSVLEWQCQYLRVSFHFDWLPCSFWLSVASIAFGLGIHAFQLIKHKSVSLAKKPACSDNIRETGWQAAIGMAGSIRNSSSQNGNMNLCYSGQTFHYKISKGHFMLAWRLGRSVDGTHAAFKVRTDGACSISLEKPLSLLLASASWPTEPKYFPLITPFPWPFWH